VGLARKLFDRARGAGLSPDLAEFDSEFPSRRVGPPGRVPGGWKGRVQIADDFDAPLPRDIEDSFYEPNL
jgi:hypothetical protein